MKPVVAIIAQGAMGAAVGRRLVEHGLKVTTALSGRSAASAARARDAGMIAVSDEDIAGADFILSIVPPGDALALAERLSPMLARHGAQTVYVDCNAVNPETVSRIADIIAKGGSIFADAGIIGGPPKPRMPGPAFYASGDAAPRFAILSQFGLDVRILPGPVGAASALKMSYAGITKGLTALAAMMMLAASRAGTAEALHHELALSQPALLAWFTRQVPAMYPKAYRWVAEMNEIAEFVGDDPAARQLFDATADFYQRLAADFRSEQKEIAALTDFVSSRPANTTAAE